MEDIDENGGGFGGGDAIIFNNLSPDGKPEPMNAKGALD